MFLILVMGATAQEQAVSPVKKDTLSVDEMIAEKIYVVSVEAENGIFTVSGYRKSNGTYQQRLVRVNPGKVYSISKIKKFTLGILTIPLKVRSAVDTFPQMVETGLTTAGITLNFFNYRMDRYFTTGGKSTHQLSAGILVAPSGEELTPETTKNQVRFKSKHLFISTGVSITYTYNDISFSFIPIGYDFATSTPGKSYIHSGQPFWGFGIGITPKIFGF